MKKHSCLSRFYLCISILTVLTLGLAVHGKAQSAGTAEIRGTITDPAGAIVPDAAVVVRNVDTGAERTLTTNTAGIYLAPLLQSGRYEVTVTKQGFAGVKRENLVLEVGQTLAVDLSLPLKTTQDSVTVTGETDLVETEKFDVSQTISPDGAGTTSCPSLPGPLRMAVLATSASGEFLRSTTTTRWTAPTITRLFSPKRATPFRACPRHAGADAQRLGQPRSRPSPANRRALPRLFFPSALRPLPEVF